MPKTTIEISLKTMVRLLLFFLLGWFLYFTRDILVIFFTAVILASVLEGPVKWLRKFRVPRGLGVILVYIVFFLIAGGSVYLLVPPITNEIKDLSQKLPALYDQIIPQMQGVKDFSVRYELLQSFQSALNYLTKNLSRLTLSLFGTLSNIFGGLFSLIVILALSFYLVVQKNALRKFLGYITPAEHQPYISNLANRIQRKIGSWLRAQILLGLSIGVLTFIGLSILRMPYALVLALFAGVMEVIPYLGPIISVIPAVLMAAATGNWFLVITIIILYIVIQQFENHILVPRVMYKAVGLNPIVVILSLLIGAKIAGFLGAILAIPSAAGLSVFLSDLVKNKETNGLNKD